jgi:hypothetical protein
MRSIWLHAVSRDLGCSIYTGRLFTCWLPAGVGANRVSFLLTAAAAVEVILRKESQQKCLDDTRGASVSFSRRCRRFAELQLYGKS